MMGKSILLLVRKTEIINMVVCTERTKLKTFEKEMIKKIDRKRIRMKILRETSMKRRNHWNTKMKKM